jgi:hypothetical protein
VGTRPVGPRTPVVRAYHGSSGLDEYGQPIR